MPPRPEREHFAKQYRQTVKGYDFRSSDKPGITGLAQVYGKYSTSAARKLRFDLMYLYDYSLIMDLKLLLKTIRVVLQREQATGVALEQPKPVMTGGTEEES
jgi:lipopolysaccharide/colanic/teichoic acid biosynthesis glycosyltransferase